MNKYTNNSLMGTFVIKQMIPPPKWTELVKKRKDLRGR